MNEETPILKQAPAKTKSGEKKPVGLIVTVIILSVAVVAVGVVLAIILTTTQGSKPSSVDKPDEETVVIEKEPDEEKAPEEHIRGNRNSKVLVVEYADPQCPGCASMIPRMDAIYEKYKNKVAFTYRHYPLSYHKNAMSAAIAIESAGLQGYFWEMLSTVFANQDDWENLSGTKLTNKYVELFKTASKSKGDVDEFKANLENSKLEEKINNDKSKGVDDKVSATPTIIVNGEQVDFMSDKSVETQIIEMIEDALDEE